MPDSRFFRAPQQEVFHDLSLFGLFEAACVERCVGEAALLLREAYSDSCLFSSYRTSLRKPRPEGRGLERFFVSYLII